MIKDCFRYIVIFASIFLLHSITIAENNIRRVEKHSVQISMDDLLKFSSLYGGIISYKRHFNSKNAIRLGFLLSGRVEERIDSIFDNRRLPLIDLGYDTIKTASIGMHLHYLRYLNPDKMIKFYYGAGLNIKHSYSYRQGRSIRDTTINDAYWDKTKKYNLAIDGFAGFEWIFIDNVSFLFEYPISAGYNISKTRTSRNDGENKQYINQWIFEYSDLKFGFSLYF